MKTSLATGVVQYSEHRARG